jgi:hypothetical protein
LTCEQGSHLRYWRWDDVIGIWTVGIRSPILMNLSPNHIL